MSDIDDGFHIFLSGTFKELQDYRDVAYTTVRDLDLRGLGMEQYPARSVSVLESSLEMADRADIYVGIFSHRYGEYTKAEYERAFERGIPIIIFYPASDAPLNAADHDTSANYDKYQALKDLLRSRHTLGTYNSPDDLKDQLKTALYHEIRQMWQKRLNQNTNTMMNTRKRQIALSIGAAIILTTVFTVIALSLFSGVIASKISTEITRANATSLPLTVKAITTSVSIPITQTAIAVAATASHGCLLKNPIYETLGIDYIGLLNGDPIAISSLQHQILNFPSLKGREAGLVTTFIGSPDSNSSNFSFATRIGEKVNSVLRNLGNQDFVFTGAVYHQPLILIGEAFSTVTLQIFLFGNSQECSQ